MERIYPKLNNLDFGDRLRILREMAGLSRKELAQIIGVTPATIGNYENGKVLPGLDRISDIGIALGVTMNMILHGCEPKKEREPLI